MDKRSSSSSTRKSLDNSLKLYSNVINNLAKDITKNSKVIQSLKTKVSITSNFIDRLNNKSMFSIKSKTLKNTYKKKLEQDIKTINDLTKKNEMLRKSQEKYISKLKELKDKSRKIRNSYSTTNSRKSSSGSINSIINKYNTGYSDTELNNLLDEVELLLKSKMKLK